MSPNLERYVDQLAVELKQESPQAAACSDFKLKSMIRSKILEHAEAEADALVAIVTMTDIVKALAQLNKLLP